MTATQTPHPFTRVEQTSMYGPSVRIPKCAICGKPRNNRAHAEEK